MIALLPSTPERREQKCLGVPNASRVSSQLHTNYYVAIHFSPRYHCIALSGMFIRAPNSRVGLDVAADGVMGHHETSDNSNILQVSQKHQANHTD